MSHSFSGRKRKPLPKKAKATRRFSSTVTDSEPYRRDTIEYKSAPIHKISCEKADRNYTKNSSHTIAPAYNKGAYQVISKQNIKDIGK